MVVRLAASSLYCFLAGFWPVLWTFFLVLLLSFNVELNPGPVCFLCSVCYKPVRVNQQALQCDLCTYWCHRVCCDVDVHTHADFQSAVVFSWTCPRCIAGVMPFHDCSVLSCSSSDTSEAITVSQCESIDFSLLD